MMSDIEDLKSMIGRLSNKVDNLMEQLYEKLYDNKVEFHDEMKNIYEMEHSKLIDLLDAEFKHIGHKFEVLLQQPNTSTTSTSSSSTQTCSTGTNSIVASENFKDVNNNLFYDDIEFARGDVYNGTDLA